MNIDIMQENEFEKWHLVEPAKTNRFVIKLLGAEIPPYLFRKYKLYNEGDEIIFVTEFFESIEFTFNPVDFFKITDVQIDYLDPTGVKHNSIKFQVKGSNFKKIGDYAEDSLTTIKMRFVADVKTINVEYITN
jgi:hypothetical protein